MVKQIKLTHAHAMAMNKPLVMIRFLRTTDQGQVNLKFAEQRCVFVLLIGLLFIDFRVIRHFAQTMRCMYMHGLMVCIGNGVLMMCIGISDADAAVAIGGEQHSVTKQ